MNSEMSKTEPKYTKVLSAELQEVDSQEHTPPLLKLQNWMPTDAPIFVMVDPRGPYSN